jgi:hypothetical protein
MEIRGLCERKVAERRGEGKENVERIFFSDYFATLSTRLCKSVSAI